MNPNLSEFAEIYLCAIGEYFREPNATGLQRAKDLGYLAMDAGLRITDISNIYQQSLEKIVETNSTLENGLQLIKQGTEWLTKTLSAFEKQEDRLYEDKIANIGEQEVMVESLPDILFSINKLGNLTKWNKELELATGLNSDALKNQRILDLFQADYRFLVAKKISEVWEKGATKIEAPFLTLAGPQLYHFKGIVMRDAKVEVVGQVYIGRNFSQQKIRDAALRESEERFRLVVENIETIFWLSNPVENKIIYVSPAYEKILGISCDRVYENPHAFLDIVHEDDRDLMKVALPLINKGNYDGEYRINRADGKLGWIHARTFPIFDKQGKLYRVAGLAQDITERKQQEMALEKSVSLLRATLEATADGIIVISNDGKIIDFNQNLVQMWHIPPDVLLSQDENELLTFLLAHVKKPEQLVKTFHHEIFVTSYILKNIIELKNGRIIEQVCIPHQLGNSIRGRVFSFRDITERKQTELALLKLNEELEIRVIERTLDLQESLTEKEVLLKEIHHRVKNNLQIIISLLKLQSYSIKDASTLHIFKDSYNRVHSLALIHEKLYSTESFASIDAADYLPSLMANLLSAYGRNTITLKDAIAPLQLDIDTAIPCGLIITELVSNALKYAFPEDRAGKIMVQLRDEGDKICLSVSDNGIGLPPDFSIEQSESLGLQLVTNLTQQLDGSLAWDTSNGTAFIITFTKPATCGGNSQ